MKSLKYASLIMALTVASWSQDATLVDVPDDVAQQIISQLEPADLASFASTSQLNAQLARGTTTFNFPHNIDPVTAAKAFSDFVKTNQNLVTLKLTGLTLPILRAIQHDLAQLHNLKRLRASSDLDTAPELKSEGMQIIADSLPQLEGLDLSDCYVGIGQGAGASIARLTHLKTLILPRNGLHDADAEAIASLPHLTSLNLNGNNLTTTGVKEIVTRLPSLIALDLGEWTHQGTTSALEYAQLPHLRELSIETYGNLDQDVAEIASLTNIEVLKLRGLLKDSSAQALKKLTKLKVFDLSGFSEIGPAIAQTLSNLLDLKVLRLLAAKFSSPEAVKALTQGEGLRLLEELDLSFANIGDTGIIAISAHCPHLRSLHMRSNELTTAGVQAISALTNLEILDLSYNQLTPDSLVPLTALVKLRNLNIGSAARTLTFSPADRLKFDHLLQNLKNLEVLGLTNVRFTPQTVSLLKQLPKLKELDVSGTFQAQDHSLREDLPKVKITPPLLYISRA